MNNVKHRKESTLAKYYYNPETRTCGVRQTIECTLTTDTYYESVKCWFRHAVKAGDVYQDRYKCCTPKVVNNIEELSELVKQSGFSGYRQFIDVDGNLYEIHQDGAFEFAPLEHNGQRTDTEINWATCFFFTEEAALAFGESLNAGHKHEDGYFRWYKPQYHEELDTWSIDYHRYAD